MEADRTPNSCKVFDIRMEHYFWNFGLVDATLPEHFVPRRLFKKSEGMNYSEVEHPFLKGFEGDDGSKVGRIQDVVIHHFSNCKGIEHLYNKVMVQYAKSNIHTPEQLDEWIKHRLMGTMPVKPAEYPLPRTIQRWFK
jgi:hypothetical protein